VSSSAPEKKGFASFLATSFELLEREMPAVYGLMCECLASRRVILSVDRESVTLAFSRRRVCFVDAETAEVHVSTTSRSVLRVIDAETNLIEAVLDGELYVRGKLDDLVVFHDALTAYVHGAVRAPSFPQLLREYRLFRRKVSRDPDVAA
jgi:hypothetical protein